MSLTSRLMALVAAIAITAITFAGPAFASPATETHPVAVASVVF